MSIFTAFLKNKNIIFKIRRSKVTDYAALNFLPARISVEGPLISQVNEDKLKRLIKICSMWYAVYAYSPRWILLLFYLCIQCISFTALYVTHNKKTLFLTSLAMLNSSGE